MFLLALYIHIGFQMATRRSNAQDMRGFELTLGLTIVFDTFDCIIYSHRVTLYFAILKRTSSCSMEMYSSKCNVRHLA